MTPIIHSNPCCKSELDLFSTNLTNTSILSSHYTQHTTAQAFKSTDDTIEISVTGTSNYIDLNNIYMVSEINVKKKGSSDDWSDNLKASTINNLAHSMFKNVEVSLTVKNDDTTITNYDSHYAYKAYLLNLLNYSEESKEGWLKNAFYYKDTSGQFDNITEQKTETDSQFLSTNRRSSSQFTYNESDKKIVIDTKQYNTGYIDRQNELKVGKGKLKFITPLHVDFLKSNKLLKDGIGMKFKFIRNSNQFCMMGEDPTEIFLLSLKLLVRKTVISEEVKKAHNNAFKISPIMYPFTTTKMRVFSINKDVFENGSGLSLGKIVPNKVIVGLVEHGNMHGDYKLNPFNFKDFGLQEIFIVTGNNTFTIKLNRYDSDFLDAYHSLCETLDVYGRNRCPIKKEDFLNGNCLFAFNLSPDKGCMGQFNNIRTADVNLHLQFKTETTTTLKVIVLCEYDNQISINNDEELSYAVKI